VSLRRHSDNLKFTPACSRPFDDAWQDKELKLAGVFLSIGRRRQAQVSVEKATTSE
jgi:hypothetical protein